MNALGIVFSNIHDDAVPELTDIRTMASIPFGGRYRLIDFVLSNMVTSGVNRVGVITKRNYRSLMDHVGSGKEWDLARKNGGLILLPPFGENDNTSLYGTRLEALKSILGFVQRSDEEYVVMSDSNAVFSVNFNDILTEHKNNNADITLMYVKRDASTLEYKDPNVVFIQDEQNRINEILTSPRVEGKVLLYANVCIMKRQLLCSLVADAIARGKNHFITDVLIVNLKRLKLFGYCFEGYYEEISSLKRFYEVNLGLLDSSKRAALFNNHEIYTKIKDSAPTKYGEKAVVKNSLISDGCIIEGEVYNSVLFRGIKVGYGTVIKNCIIMQDSIIGENVTLNSIIADKHVVVRDKRMLSGSENFPFFIPKDSTI